MSPAWRGQRRDALNGEAIFHSCPKKAVGQYGRAVGCAQWLLLNTSHVSLTGDYHAPYADDKSREALPLS